jgi:hypothetical protein
MGGVGRKDSLRDRLLKEPKKILQEQLKKLKLMMTETFLVNRHEQRDRKNEESDIVRRRQIHKRHRRLLKSG